MTRSFFLIAGEASGDQLGAHLMEGLTSLDPATRFTGVGGAGMARAGLGSLFPMEELSVMGLTEVLPRLPRLLRRIRETTEAVLDAKPDALITIDSPDFCLRVARAVRRHRPDLPVIHYVAPSVWAWRPGRAAKMARHVDHVLALLPFEPPLMEAAGMSCDFVGHPVTQLPLGDGAAFRARHDLGARPILCLLPGSRLGELRRHAAVFGEVATRLAEEMPTLAVVIPAAAPIEASVRAEMGQGVPPPLIVSDDAEKRDAMASATVALAASGTISLELARQGTPQVIAYRMAPVTAAIMRRMVKIDTVTLVNLVTETREVPEYLLEACRADMILPALRSLFAPGPERDAQKQAAADAMRALGAEGDSPGLRAAQSVLRFLDRGASGVARSPRQKIT